jgi:chemotaxis protein methyltransferase CheR
MPLAEADIEYIRQFVRQGSAIVLDNKEYLIETRLETLAASEGLAGLANLMRALRDEQDEPRTLHRKVVDALTTNETLFFRDVHPFEALRKMIIPELLERNRITRSLRIWSAACSAGQEPLSLAMLLRVHFPQLESWRIELLATDLSDEMLAQARSGCYSQIEVNRGLPAALLVRFFEDRGSHWQVAPEIRQMIRFERFNLIQPWPARPACDLILLRNVMIYFDVEVKRAILARLARSLAPGGYLLLGAAETVVGLSEEFEPVTIGRTAFYRKKA